MVMGARQVGKSTLTQQIASHDHPAETLTLDDKATRDAATNDPTAFVAGLTRPALIDEVQRAPELLLAIKESVDSDRRPGRFLLTGSANILTAPNVYEALTGRIEVVHLWPLAQAEIAESHDNLVTALFSASPPQISDGSVGRDAFVDRVAQGGYPEARLRTGKRRGKWFASYLTTTLERDLRDISDARRLDEVPRLLRLLATRAAGVLNSRSIARSLSITYETVQTYTRLLETIFLVRTIPAWRPGLGPREFHARKVYIVDSGLLAHLLSADERRIGTDDQITGRLLENFVAMEVLRLAEWAEIDARLFHYRRDRDEIDLLLESPSGEIVAIEVKAAATVGRQDYRPIEKLRDARGPSFLAGAVIYTGKQTLPLSNRIWAVPVSALWSAGR